MPTTIKVKSLETIEKNYKGSTSEAQRRYLDEVDNIVWQEFALIGHAKYDKAMSDPTIRERQKKGVAASSDAEIKAGMREGGKVLSSRMTAASGKHRTGYAPTRDKLDGLVIPDSTDDYEQNIDNRLKPVVKAMKEAKEEKYK